MPEWHYSILIHKYPGQGMGRSDASRVFWLRNKRLRKLAADDKSLNKCSDFYHRQPLLGYNRGFYEKQCLLLHSDTCRCPLTDAYCPVSDSAWSAPTLIFNELQMWHDFRLLNVQSKTKSWNMGKNGLPFPFSFVIGIGEYTLFPRVKIFAMVKNI